MKWSHLNLIFSSSLIPFLRRIWVRTVSTSSGRRPSLSFHHPKSHNVMTFIYVQSHLPKVSSNQIFVFLQPTENQLIFRTCRTPWYSNSPLGFWFRSFRSQLKRRRHWCVFVFPIRKRCPSSLSGFIRWPDTTGNSKTKSSDVLSMTRKYICIFPNIINPLSSYPYKTSLRKFNIFYQSSLGQVPFPSP